MTTRKSPTASLADELRPALEQNWGRSHLVLKGAADVSGHVSSAFIRDRLEASLLKWPYFALLKHGEKPPVAAYTTVRDVIGQKRGGFPDAEAVRRLMAGGASLKLNQLADWHRPTRELGAALESFLPVMATAYAFWTPVEQRGMLPHRDAAHVVAIQLEGRKEWHLYAEPEQIGAGAGLDVDSTRSTHTFTLEPGDVLYLPHGWPHDAVARDGDSLHLTYTLTEPTPEHLLEAARRIVLDAEQDLVHRFHTRSLTARTAEVRRVIERHTEETPAEEWHRTALELMKEAVG